MDGTKFNFAIDRGGTFTDVWASCPQGGVRVLKLLSEDPKHYKDAPTEAIRRILQEETGETMPRGTPVNTDHIGWIRMGTTVATNALLERKGQRMAFAVTKGFRDLLHIGNQARPDIFDLVIDCPDVLYEDVIEVEERLIPWRKDDTEAPDRTVMGSTGERLTVLQPLNEEKLREDLKQLLDKGIQSLSVLLMHSYSYSAHEVLVGTIAREMGFTHVSLSGAVSPMVKAVPRGYTACSDAYLTPIIRQYLQSFASGFKDNLKGVRVSFMQSDGGLTPMESFIGSRAILSGPAGGVVGYAKTTNQPSSKDSTTAPSSPSPVIGFDMGGTSTDVSRFAGTYEHVFESVTAGIALQAPQLDINTVAAGGGSRLFFHSGMFVVGPESAGANPGPVCYQKGGPLAVTDANLILGRLLPHHFPKIFGPSEDQPLDLEATRKAFQQITEEVNSISLDHQRSVEEVALGFIDVANEAMCRPIRALTQAKGHDTSSHTLAVFGGAGGQHACAIARSLGMRKVYVHRYAGILSAYGLALADSVYETQEPCAKTYKKENYNYFEERLRNLELICREKLMSEGFQEDDIRYEVYLHLRYIKTDCALMCPPTPIDGDRDGTKRSTRRSRLMEEEGVGTYGCFRKSFHDRYMREFGFVLSERTILVDDVRVRGVASSGVNSEHLIERSTLGEVPPQPIEETEVYFVGGKQKASVYSLDSLKAGHEVAGPAIILDKLSTILLERDCFATITGSGDVSIAVRPHQQSSNLSTELDPIQLSIFSHRFMSLAEQMGRVLQRTSISTNIKERLDFSCAVFGPDGGLVSNAPHIPVHLGAMQETVQYQLSVLGDTLCDGDVLLSNHPQAGGSHLPDLTVITPVFFESHPRPVFYVASRGHHADIGGITPGSMPPHSTSIHQEGAVFFSFKLVKGGVFQEADLIKALDAPGTIENSSATRNLQDNLSDLKAQVAANHKGIQLVKELIGQYSLEVVQAYMKHIQTSAEMAVRELLKKVGGRTAPTDGKRVLSAEDFMDDGTIIAVTITIDSEEGSAVVDFEGTGPEVWGNCNAPRAISVSALIYCLRCMVGHDTPLNQGCLAPITLKLPTGSILNPSEDAAVVGGNVQTSQRVVDVILRAFGACAASQGCMNNITFGDSTIGYYETVAGGAGAGPGWHGRSGVHTHMTNTRITDPEILELRYPIHLTTFTLVPGTGGDGKYRGGDGVVRELLFRSPLTLSILTERRVFAPYGLCGGQPASKGVNLLTRKNGRVIRLPSKSSVEVLPGDKFRLQTPGGGGYGPPSDRGSDNEKSPNKKPSVIRGSVVDYNRLQETA